MSENKDFDLPAWLLDDDYGSKDFEVFTHPKTKAYLEARNAYDIALGEFNELSADLLKEDADPGLTMDEVDPRQERLEVLRDDLEKHVTEVNELAEEVSETRHVVTVQDRLDFGELEALTKQGGTESEGFYLILAEVGSLDGQRMPRDGWQRLARKCGIFQWATVQANVMEFLGQAVVTPDFSQISLPTPRE